MDTKYFSFASSLLFKYFELQPGDVQVTYQKNENEDIQNKYNKKITDFRKGPNKEIDSTKKPKENEPTIIEFLKKMRLDNEKKKTVTNTQKTHAESDENEDITSTQNMITYARARKDIPGKYFNCKNCEFKIKSVTILKQHEKNCHQNKKKSG